MKFPLVVMMLLVINKRLAENTGIGDCSVQGDSPGLVFSLACFDLKMWRYFPGVSKTHNKKVVKETTQKADAKDRDREEEEHEEEIVFTEKNDDGVGDDDESGVRL